MERIVNRNIPASYKMLLARIALSSVLVHVAFCQFTKIVKHNPLLSRKKRYLMFPEKSNFVIGMAYVKALIMVQPRGWNALGECDFPFPLPSDTRPFFKKKRRNHHVQKREIFSTLETGFTRGGFNGSACVKRMICEARQYVDTQSKSLVKDVISAIFASDNIDWDGRYKDSCHTSSFSECEIPFLNFILGSLFAT